MKISIKTGTIALLAILGISSIALRSWAACNSPNGVEVTVDITAPVADQKLVMVGTGVDLKKEDGSAFTALTAASSGDEGDQLKWTFTGFSFPSGNSDTPVAVKTPATWPTSNSFWGEKDVELEYDGGVEGTTGDCEAKVGVKVFFDSQAYVGATRTWYYYWKGGAVNKLSSLTHVSSITMPDGNPANGVCIPINNFSVTAALGIETLHNNSSAEVRIASYANDDKEDWPSYMEHTASVVEHELNHQQRTMDIYNEIEMHWNAWYNSLGFFTKMAMSVDEAKEQIFVIWDLIDHDRDHVNDYTDDPDIGADDNEDFAEAAETGTGCDTSEDWSRYGKKWFE